jgi:hypothetical protein
MLMNKKFLTSSRQLWILRPNIVCLAGTSLIGLAVTVGLVATLVSLALNSGEAVVGVGSL